MNRAKSTRSRLSFLRASAAAFVMLASAQAARADSFFWAVNQFHTVQKLNGNTGAVVDSFEIPVNPGSTASIAVVGNTGYYTHLGDSNVYKVDMTTHADGGVAFNIGATAGYTNGITTDASGHLYFADGGGGPLKEFTTSGTLVSTNAFPSAANAYRDGSVVFGNSVVTNRGDQSGPYDLYSILGIDQPLVLVTAAFINPAINGQSLSGSNGIAFNGVNFFTSDEQFHRVSMWDLGGNFVSYAALDPASRYENWTFASQDIIPIGGGVPEPATWAMMMVGIGGIGLSMRFRRRQVAALA